MIARRAWLLAAALCACGEAPEPRGTNVFLVSLDSAAARYVEPYGAEAGSTPQLAQLARDSVVFENAYSQTATTVSSVASLLSGQRATTHKVEPTSMQPLAARTLMETLARHGYRGFGFIANPMAGLRRVGFHRGFDVYLRIYAHQHGSTRDNPVYHEEAGASFKLVYPEDVQAVVEELISHFRPSHTFAYLHYLQPHLPYDPPARYRGVFAPDEEAGPDWETLRRGYLRANETGQADPDLVALLQARYRANLLYADAGVGALLDALKSAGLYDEALIVVTADHGEAFFDHGRLGHNYTLYDDMTRVPLILKFPASDGIEPRHFAHPTETVDLLPTLFDYLGVPVPEQAEGVSLWPLIRGEREALERPEVVLSTAARDRHAIRLGAWKLIVDAEGGGELYHLARDPDEQNDLAAAVPERVAELRQRLARALGSVGGAPERPVSDWEIEPELRELLETLGYAEVLPEASAP